MTSGDRLYDEFPPARNAYLVSSAAVDCVGIYGGRSNGCDDSVPGECSPSFIRLEINIVDAQAPTRTGTGRHPSHNGIDPSRPAGPTCWSNKTRSNELLSNSSGPTLQSRTLFNPRKRSAAARTPASSTRFSPESAPNGVQRSRLCGRTQQPCLVLE